MKIAYHMGLTGRVKPSIVRAGEVIWEGDWTKNLWLDQGLDEMAARAICDCFLVAAKGTGDDPTKEDLSATANTYSITNGSANLTRTAGTRDFSADDVGKLIRFSTTPFQEFTIQTFNSATSVDVTPNASPAVANKKILLYSVQQVGLEAEVGRTNTYSAAALENGTTTADAVRTFTRTFVFPTEDTLIEVVPSDNNYSQTATTVTRQTGTRDFTSGDVGSTITFATSGLTALITAFIGATSVTVNVSQTNSAQGITLSEPNSAKVIVVTGSYSRSGATVTRDSGARDFTANDIGRIIHFATANVESEITAYTDATHVTVADSGTIASQSITLYDFTDYAEVGFSHTMERGDNLNIRVALTSPVRVHRSTPLRASEQLKLAYQCQLTVSPSTVQTGSLASAISDPGNQMSGNKAGKFAIETFATSQVASSGQTNLAFTDLEPYYPGYLGLSLDTGAPDSLSDKIRSNGAAYTAFTASAYTDGAFTNLYTGNFGLNDAISNTWRSLMLYNPSSTNAIFTFLFDASQKKDSEHTLQFVFRKSWGRDLS